MKQLTFGSLFAGIGGFDLGFERAGMRGLWQVEIDSQANVLLSVRFGDAKQYDDVRKVGAAQLAPVDVICGGFPCQDLSSAGKRAGLKGARSGLFYELTRIVSELRPRYVVWENVPGLLSSDRGRDFARVLHELARIGYFGAWRTLDARYLGVAQRRRRIFGVFARADLGAERGSEILSLVEGLRGHPAPRVEAGEEIAGPLGACSEGGGRRTTDLDGHGAYVAGTLTIGAADTYNGRDIECGLLVAGTITAKAAKAAKGTGGPAGHECQNLIADTLTGNPYADNLSREGCLVAHTLTSGGADASEDGTERGLPLVADTVTAGGRKQDQNGGLGLVAFIPRTRGDDGRGYMRGPSMSEDLAPTLETVKVPCVGFPARMSGTQAQTAITDDLSPSLQSTNPTAVANRQGVRRLTPRECERLQGFPDDWTAGFADAVRYRMLGNAVAVPVAHWIGRQIVKTEAAHG